ncbi:hypothetical protein [Pseudomonas mandelii]|uniref:hypothetical protein n=1 Tax=Pseudomonas mandelii TaxID=75612 RepID=UPI0020A01B37|nr:hypothetical protein [Pseudomonas mandelii]MCO8314473.1 hypothetical protein [Pseudomonas mandelii]
MDFSKHPLFIGATAVAATIAIFHQYIVPIYEKQNNNTIIELTKDLNTARKELTESIEKNTNIQNDNKSKTATLTSRLESKIISLEASKTELEKKILQLQEEERFSAETPFPKGFRDIQIFDEYSKIPTTYKNSDYTEDSIFTSTEISDRLFSRITYYQFQCNETNLVRQVFFHFTSLYDTYKAENRDGPFPTDEEETKLSKKNNEALVKIFSDKYGNPISVKQGKTTFQTSEHTRAIIDDSGLIIFSQYNPISLSVSCLKEAKNKEIQESAASKKK